MFHEVAYPIEAGQRWRHRFLAHVQRFMARIVRNVAEETFVSTSAWTPRLLELSASKRPIHFAPVPSNLSEVFTPTAVQELRRKLVPENALLLGTFGTYSGEIRLFLDGLLPALIADSPARWLLIAGHGAEAFGNHFKELHPALAPRVLVRPSLARAAAVAHLAACDLLVQPDPDGVTCRRGSTMAPLALGRPVLTTSGALTEALWGTGDAVAHFPVEQPSLGLEKARALLSNPPARSALGERGRAFYQTHFSWRRTVERLRSLANQ